MFFMFAILFCPFDSSHCTSFLKKCTMPIPQNFITKTHSELGSSVVNLHAVQLSCRAEAPVIDDLTVTDIHGVDHFHFFMTEAKIPDGEIFLHPFSVNCPRYGGDPPLQMPAENDLRGGPAVFLRNFDQSLMMKNVFLSLGQRSPGFRDHAVTFHDPYGFPLPPHYSRRPPYRSSGNRPRWRLRHIVRTAPRR